MADTFDPTIRFRKDHYAGGNSAGDEPKWHISAYAYKKGEMYLKYP